MKHLFTVVILLISTQAWSEDFSAEGKITIFSCRLTFEQIVGKELGTFALVSSTSETRILLNTLEEYQMLHERETTDFKTGEVTEQVMTEPYGTNRFIDPDYKNLNPQLVLKEIGARKVHIRSQTNPDFSKVSARTILNIESLRGNHLPPLNGVFTEGDWPTFLAGQKVRIKLTEESLENLKVFYLRGQQSEINSRVYSLENNDDVKKNGAKIIVDSGVWTTEADKFEISIVGDHRKLFLVHQGPISFTFRYPISVEFLQ